MLDYTIACGTDKYIFKFNSSEEALFYAREKRKYTPKIQHDRLISIVNSATNYLKLEQIVKQYDICDYASFENLNTNVVKKTIICLDDVMTRFPQVRAICCYIGSMKGFEKIRKDALNGDYSIVKKVGLQDIIARQNLVTYAKLLNAISMSHDSLLAFALYTTSLMSGILIDEEDFDAYKYLNAVKSLRNDESTGFHPVGSGCCEYIIYHEIGHMVDYAYNITTSTKFINIKKMFSDRTIETQLSKYALTNDRELFAEAFAEIRCNKSPRTIATNIAKIINSI